jgi:DNA-binding NarL/FixJ family response regulator
LAKLTRRELEVLRVLTNGVSTARAATGLNVSVSTLRGHIKSILAKLGVHSRTEALAFAFRHSIIPLQGAPSRNAPSLAE